MSPLRLRIDGDHLVVERPKGGRWASDGWELVARLDRLQAANLCADLGDWLAGGAQVLVLTQVERQTGHTHE